MTTELVECPGCGDRLPEREFDPEEECCPACLEESFESRYWDDEPDFADPGGNSALRAATRDNPRNLPCPTCGAENVLTPADRARGYQCDRCADRAERGGW